MVPKYEFTDHRWLNRLSDDELNRIIDGESELFYHRIECVNQIIESSYKLISDYCYESGSDPVMDRVGYFLKTISLFSTSLTFVCFEQWGEEAGTIVEQAIGRISRNLDNYSSLSSSQVPMMAAIQLFRKLGYPEVQKMFTECLRIESFRKTLISKTDKEPLPSPSDITIHIIKEYRSYLTTLGGYINDGLDFELISKKMDDSFFDESYDSRYTRPTEFFKSLMLMAKAWFETNR